MSRSCGWARSSFGRRRSRRRRTARSGLVYVCRVLGGELRASHESLELAWLDPRDPAIEWHLDHGERVLRVLAAE